VLDEISKKHNRTVRQVVLNFLTRDSKLYTIPKAANPDHVRENSGGSGNWQLIEEDIAKIKKTFPLPPPDGRLEMI
jgi:diketogulonate reductase-like aldo/keto reductase